MTDADDGRAAHAAPPPVVSLPVERIDPLPHAYATTGPGVGGVIKARPEDFLVDELPLYEPEGEGEHLYLLVQKRNVSHAEMLSVLRRHFGVDELALGFAGMKDKAGVTRQMVSVHMPGEAPPTDVGHDRIHVLWSARHRNKLRLGHLAGNRFSIRIRDVDPLHAPRALSTLREMERSGMPNYFGGQRFGYRRVNHVMGACVLLGDWRTACTHLLGSGGWTFPEYQRPKRELYDAGRYEEASAMWTTADRTEHIVCKKLARGYRPRDALLAVGRSAVDFWISALQSAVFNRVLDHRVRLASLTTLTAGDIACKHENRALFAVTDAGLPGGSLQARMVAQEIAVTGPLWGRGMLPATDQVGAMERAALADAGFDVEQYLAFKRCPEGQRRPLTVPVRNAQLEAGLDEHGEFIRVAFDLPRGSYATVALREIMKNDAAEHDVADDHP